MTQFLPPNLLALFAPREPLPYLPPPDKLPHEKNEGRKAGRGGVHTYDGIAQFIAGNFEDPEDTPPPLKVENREERLERKKREKEEQVAYKLEQEIALWDPNSNPEATSDPFKTLFLGRVNYYTSESKIRREFEQYGTIKTIRMVSDINSGKPRGYAYIEYEHERDMHSAYKHADGMKIDGRRVLVDVERARTVKGWLPRRLGGGLGGTRRGGNDVNIRHSGREDGSGRRSRSRDNSEPRGFGSHRDRRHRSRSKERRRRRSRSRSKESRRRRRSRSKSGGERRRRRSRSRDRKRSRRSRSKSRDRTKRERRGDDGFRVKDEPRDGMVTNEYGYQVKQERTHDDPEDGMMDPDEQKPNVDNNGAAYEQY